MNDKVIPAICFVAGGIIGSLVTWLSVKAYYRNIADEEIEAVRSVYIKPKNPEPEPEETPKKDESIRESALYSNMIKREGYVDYSANDSKTEESKEIRPYVISEDDYGRNDDDYEMIALTYYSNGVLCDDVNEPVDDVDECVGEDSLKLLGDDGLSVIYVRNDKRECIYEIAYDLNEFDLDDWSM